MNHLDGIKPFGTNFVIIMILLLCHHCRRIVVAWLLCRNCRFHFHFLNNLKMPLSSQYCGHHNVVVVTMLSSQCCFCIVVVITLLCHQNVVVVTVVAVGLASKIEFLALGFFPFYVRHNNQLFLPLFGLKTVFDF